VTSVRQVEGTDHHGGADHRDEDARQALAALEEKDHRERAAAHGERRPVRGTAEDLLADSPQAEQWPVTLDREAEELRELADQNRQRDAVHVAVADRLGQKLGDEAEPYHAGQDAHRAGDDRHRAGQRDGTVRIAAGQGKDDAEDDRGQRRIRTQDEDAARPEQRIGQQRDYRRVQAVDPGHARRHRIGDAHRDQHRGQDEARHDVVPQPGRVVVEQQIQPRQPAREAKAGTGRRTRYRRGRSHPRAALSSGSARYVLPADRHRPLWAAPEPSGSSADRPRPCGRGYGPACGG
jgi:hypothetical protein